MSKETEKKIKINRSKSLHNILKALFSLKAVLTIKLKIVSFIVPSHGTNIFGLVLKQKK